jgi:hypothetical protein
MSDSNPKERRRQQRLRFEGPASLTTCGHRIAASTKNLSQRGLFLFTELRFELGSEIDVVLRIPFRGMVCCHGCVVRSDSSGGQYGVAVQIDRFAPVRLVVCSAGNDS